MSDFNKINRISFARRRMAPAEPLVPSLALKALRAALGTSGEPKPKPHKKTGSAGGSSSKDAKAGGSGAGARAHAAGSSAAGKRAGATKGAAGTTNLFDELGLPPNPTPAQIDKLTKDIRAETRSGGQASDAPVSWLNPAALTPLQRSLMTALNGMSRDELKSHPELLDAVRKGFATPGGRQLAWAVDMLDHELVGNLASGSRVGLREWPLPTDSQSPESIVSASFDIDDRLPPEFTAVIVDWVEEAQAGAGRGQLNDLVNGGPVRIVLDPDQREPVRVDTDSRTITVKGGRSLSRAQLRAALGELSAAQASQTAAAREAAGNGLLVDSAIEFDASIPVETRRIIQAAAENSPTLRNVLLRSMARYGKINIKVDNSIPFRGQITFTEKLITVNSSQLRSPAEMAETIIFELTNSAQSNVLVNPEAHFAANIFTDSQVDDAALMINRGLFRKDLGERNTFLTWARQHELFPTFEDYKETEAGRSLSPDELDDALIRDDDLLNAYMDRTYGRADLRKATRFAIASDTVETDTMLLTNLIGSELESLEESGRLIGTNKGLLTEEVIKKLRSDSPVLERWAATGNIKYAALTEQIAIGHTGITFQRRMEQLSEAAPLTIDRAEAAEADAALTEAGAAAGAAAHTDLRTAVDTHGPGNPAAIAEAAEASLWKRSQALAAQMLEHPNVKSGLRLTGRGLEGAALAAMVYGLAKAIHTDVKNGDHTAPATRKALAELLGGLSLGLGGAAVGARVGAALGSLVGPITAAVGGFVGGLFGGALGFAAGTRLVDQAFDNDKQPLDHLIDSVLDQQGDIAAANAGAIGALQALTGSGGGTAQSLPGGAPEPKAQAQAPAEPSQDQLNLAQRVVQAGSTNDGYANRKELIAGFEEARYRLEAGQDAGDFTDAFPVNRLIAAYGASGSGALTEDELAQAIADGALVIHDDGTVTVDTAVLHARQRSQAGNIASRVVDTGAKAETADEGDLRDGFGEAGYSLKASGEDIDALMRVFGDGNGRIGKSELAAAIQVGAVVIAADGTVTVDKAVLALAA